MQFVRLYGVIICDEMYFIRLFRTISVKSYLPVPLGGGEILNMGQLSWE